MLLQSVASLILFAAGTTAAATPPLHLQHGTPTYCVDPQVLLIASARAEKCFHRHGSASQELTYLRGVSVADYHRAHELLAFQYFVEYKANPYRRPCESADFEYIPLLPLAWRSGVPTSTSCTAGGYCPRTNVTGDPDACSVKALIDDIVSIVQIFKANRKQTDLGAGIPKFTVASTYNLRTYMAFGLPSAARSGPTHAAVTAFVTATMIGHYERQPQCPDTLRKQWRLIVEVPFLSLLDAAADLSNGLLVEGAHNGDITPQPPAQQARKTTFLFAGRLFLWLPDRVCSVRNAVAALVPRADTAVVNVTEAEARGPLKARLVNDHLLAADFCLVTKADSYATAFFYDAVHAGCIPVVVSDWFVFAFPAVVPYHLFVVRVAEEDFLKDAHAALDHVKSRYTAQDKAQMRVFMRHWGRYLSFAPQSAAWVGMDVLRGAQELYNFSSPRGNVVADYAAPALTAHLRPPPGVAAGAAARGMTVLPFELMLREMVYHLSQRKYDKEKEEAAKAKKKVTNPLVETRDLHCYAPASCLSRTPALPLKDVVKERRPHLCKHAPRLVGHYKIVFFMQCVRILWPLHPGAFKPSDRVPGALSDADVFFIKSFHNASKNTSVDWYSTWTTYPVR